MTTPLEPTPFDQGNPILAGGPAQITVTLVDSADGQNLALTIRTASTTLTVVLARDDARAWAAAIRSASDQLSSSRLVVAGAAAMPVLNGKAGG